MNSKERVRMAMRRERPDRVPAAFEAVASVTEKLLKHYGYDDIDQLYERYDIDIIPISPTYTGDKNVTWVDENGQKRSRGYWGGESREVITAVDTYWEQTGYPLTGVDTLEKLNEYQFPSVEDFDYSSITRACEKYADKAIIIGHEGPFQHMCSLMKMAAMMMLMVDDEELAHEMFQRMVDFEYEYYKRCFEAGNGKVDILRTHDDYGTQISMLFSLDMWKDFFMENTKRLVDLAHQYGAYFQQHSCGAVEPVIPLLIECGVDALEPVQKVAGLEPEHLAEAYGDHMTFHGGIDTQGLLPNGTPEQVQAETRHFMTTLGQNGGYILMASQGFEGDVPIENIEAIYSVDRTL